MLFKKEISKNQMIMLRNLIGKTSKFISIIMVFALIFSVFNWGFIAKALPDRENVIEEEKSENVQNNISEEDQENIEAKESASINRDLIPIVSEDVSKRAQNEKHFQKLDGSYEVVIYGYPVHYEKNGKWLDIDNTLSDLDWDKTQKADYENSANKFKVKFPKNLDENKGIHIKQDNYEINWNILSIDKSTANVNKNVQNKSADLKSLNNLEQKLIYKDIYANRTGFEKVDLEYSLTSQMLKENFILNKYIPNFSVIMELDVKDLIITLEDGILIFKNNNGKVIFQMDKLYMFDSSNKYSFEIDIKLSELKKNKYQFIIKPDDEWLKGASYPVVVDPTIESPSSISINDTYVVNSYPEYNNATSPTMTISETSREVRGLLNFTFPSSLKNQVITYSHLTLTRSGSGTANRQINLYKNTNYVNLNNYVTWSSKPNYNSRVIDYCIVDKPLITSKYIFDITKAVKEWQAENYAIVPGFTICDNNKYGASNSVYSSEAANSSDRPVIEIGYESSAGLKDYWTYTSQDMGVAGVGYVSDYTGNLTLVRNDFAYQNQLSSLPLTFYYNIVNKNTNFGYGNGWLTNYHLKLDEGASGRRTKLLKPDGNIVHFVNEVYTPDGEPRYKYLAEDGSGDELIFSNDYHYTLLKTKAGIDYHFDAYGNLDRIENTKTHRGLDILYHYESGALQYKINYITDEKGNKIKFSYSGNNYTTELVLVGPNGSSKTLEKVCYYANSNLEITHITKEHNYSETNQFELNSSISYLYNSNELVVTNNINKNKVNYQYTNSKVTKIVYSDVKVDGSNETINLGYLDIDYQLFQTIYTNHKGDKVYYTFDNYGHTINVMDNRGNTISYKYTGLFSYNPNYRGYEDGYDIINQKPDYYNVHKLVKSSTWDNQTIELRQNLLNNHSFEIINGDWSLSNANKVSIFETGVMKNILGDYAILINGNSSQIRYFEQDITGKLYSGLRYTIGGWAKADAVPSKAYKDSWTKQDGRFFGLMIVVECYDDYYEYGWTENFYFHFNSSISDWQYQMFSFIFNDIDNYTIESIKVRGVYQGEGTAYFDHIQLYSGGFGNDYTYNSVGNLVKKADSLGNTSTYTYDRNDNLDSITENGITSSITNNSDGLLESITRNNVKISYNYNGFDQVDKVTYGSLSDKWFTSKTAYTSSNKYIKSVTNEFDNTISYTTDELTTLIKDVTDAMGNYQEYKYNANGDLTDSIRGRSYEKQLTDSYTYDEANRLFTIKRKGYLYRLIYDDLDRVKSVEIVGGYGSAPLFTNTYQEDIYNGITYQTNKLLSTTYGDGDILSFTYDDESRVKQIKFNGNLRFEYEYDENSRLSKYIDHYNNENYIYFYDSSNRISSIRGNGANETKYNYDKFGNLSNYLYINKVKIKSFFINFDIACSFFKILSDISLYYHQSQSLLPQLVVHLSNHKLLCPAAG